MGNHGLAILDFQRAIELDEKYAPALFHIGTSKLHSQDIKGAAADF